MRQVHAGQRAAHKRILALQVLSVEIAAHEFEPEVYQPGVQDIGLAVVTNFLDATFEILVPHLVPTHPQLARETQHDRDFIELGERTIIEVREHIHQIHVAPVIAAQVVVPFKVTVGFTVLPIARRLDTVFERAVVQDRQIEAAAVPGDQVGRIAFDAVKETLDEFRLAGALITEAPDLEGVGRPKCHGDCHHTMLVQRQEIVPDSLLAFEGHCRCDVLVGQTIQFE